MALIIKHSLVLKIVMEKSEHRYFKGASINLLCCSQALLSNKEQMSL
jgi:hypothetical protein